MANQTQQMMSTAQLSQYVAAARAVETARTQTSVTYLNRSTKITIHAVQQGSQYRVLTTKNCNC
jgi:hypothetical protein